MTGTWLPDRHGDTYTPSPAAQVIAAAVQLRDLERAGQFQTDDWWDASQRLRDATDRLEVGFNDEEKAS